MSALALAAAGLTLLAPSIGACGGAGDKTSSAGVVEPVHRVAQAGRVATVSPKQFRGDEDDDDSVRLESEENPLDSDGDKDVDAKDNVEHGYHDGDDGRWLRFGHPASPGDRHAIVTLVERYYAAAAAGDGVAACSMMYSILAEALPEDYGEAPGPVFLRGAKTCAAVLTGLFRHTHAGLSRQVAVTGVRVQRNKALALLGSGEAPASMIEVKRERGVWKIDDVLAAPLA